MKLVQTAILHKTKYLSLVSTTYEDTKGIPREWVWATRGGTNAVVVAATCCGKLIVIKEFRVPINGYEFSLPAGLIDAGETPLEAAERELHEETGFHIKKVIKSSRPLYSSPGLTDEAIIMVYAEAAGSLIHAHREDSEDIKVSLMSRKDVMALLARPTAKIGQKSWFVFEKFAETGKL